MKRIIIRRLLLSSLLTFLVTAIYAQSDMVTKTMNFSNISAIDANYCYEITVTEGTSNKIEVSFPKEIEDYVVIEKDANTLICSTDFPKNFFGRNRHNNCTIKISMQMEYISSIKLSGAAKLSLTGNFGINEDLTMINLSGASELTGDYTLSGKDISCYCSGAAEATVKGVFNDVRVTLSGAAYMVLRGNINEKLTIRSSGASSFSYNGDVVNNDNQNQGFIMASSSGASKIKLTGRACNVNYSASGAANIDGKDLVARNGKAVCSGGSNIKIHGTESLDLGTSGGGNIRYWGNAPKIISRNSSIKEGGD